VYRTRKIIEDNIAKQKDATQYTTAANTILLNELNWGDKL